MAKITISENALVRVEGIPLFRVLNKEGKVVLQLCDNDRMRSRCRGTRFVEIHLQELAEKLTEHIEEK